MPAADLPAKEDSSPAQGEARPDTSREERAGRVGRNVAFFSFATGLSRVLGLAREVVAAGYFGVTGAMSAFTIAFQVPNLVRALFADAALQGAFVPVFTELLEHGRKREALRLASTLFFLILAVLGLITIAFIVAANAAHPLTMWAQGALIEAEGMHMAGDAPRLAAVTLCFAVAWIPARRQSAAA